MSTEGLDTDNSPAWKRRDTTHGVVVWRIAGSNDNRLLGPTEQPAHRKERLGLECCARLGRLPGVVAHYVPPLDKDHVL